MGAPRFDNADSRSRLNARCAPRFVSAIEWISSTMTQRMLGRICLAALVRSRNSDSGVVIRMSGGCRSICRRSRVGVSPVRMATVIGDCFRPIRSAAKVGGGAAILDGHSEAAK